MYHIHKREKHFLARTDAVIDHVTYMARTFPNKSFMRSVLRDRTNIFEIISIFYLFIYTLYTSINPSANIENKFVGDTLFYNIFISMERSKQLIKNKDIKNRVCRKQ